MFCYCWFKTKYTNLKFEVRAIVIIHRTYVYIVEEEYALVQYAVNTYLCAKKGLRRVFPTLRAAHLGELSKGIFIALELATLTAGHIGGLKQELSSVRIFTSATTVDGDRVKHTTPDSLLLAVLYIALARHLQFNTVLNSKKTD